MPIKPCEAQFTHTQKKKKKEKVYEQVLTNSKIFFLVKLTNSKIDFYQIYICIFLSPNHLFLFGYYHHCKYTLFWSHQLSPTIH